MKKSITLILIAALLFSILPVSGDPPPASGAPAPPQILAPTAILIDAKSGKVLYEKNADQKMYPASTTKIMTGLLAVEHGKLDEVVTAGDGPARLIERGSSQIYIQPGEQFTMEQLLYALMLESANDAAVAIAEHISGNVESFAALMNKKAKELGAVNTNFVNPNGLHKDQHYTTPRDLALIARYAMTLPKFREVVGTIKYTIPQTNKQPERNYITNSNKLIWKTMDKYRYEFATGIKTGYTVAAKHCLVGGAKKGDTELISVIMGAEGKDIYTDTKTLFEYGFANFENVKLLQKGQIMTTVPITTKEKTEKLNLAAAEDFSMLLDKGEKDNIESKITINKDINTPIKKGDALGAVTYFLNGKEVKKVKLLSTGAIAAPIKHTIAWWKWLLIVIALFLLYRTIVTINKSRRRRRRQGVYFVRR